MTDRPAADPFAGLVVSTSIPPSYDDLAELFARAEFPPGYRAWPFRNPLFTVSVRTDEGRLVAYSSLHPMAGGAALEWTDLAVDPGFQNRGIGTELGQMVIREARRILATSGERWLRLYAKPRRNLADRYKRQYGFETVDGDELLGLKIYPHK